MQDFRKLKIWVRSSDFVKDIYHVTGSFPNAEIYGITSQIRRSAISIPANISEVAGRRDTTKDFKRFINISIGSANELYTYLIVSKGLKYLSEAEFNKLMSVLEEIKAMLLSFNRTLK
jgi:four helix bundle protein